jgi:hypothetical protein
VNNQIDRKAQKERVIGEQLKIDYTKLSCTGCGVKIQTEEPDQIGYLSKHKIETHFKK